MENSELCEFIISNAIQELSKAVYNINKKNLRRKG